MKSQIEEAYVSLQAQVHGLAEEASNSTGVLYEGREQAILGAAEDLVSCCLDDLVTTLRVPSVPTRRLLRQVREDKDDWLK